MNGYSARSTHEMNAQSYQKLLKELYNRHRKDDGKNLQKSKKVKGPKELGFVQFRSMQELKRMNPKRKEFWLAAHPSNKKNHPTKEIPPDPLSDEMFRKIRKRVCVPPCRTALLEESIHRCEIPEAEQELYAEDLTEDETASDFIKEVSCLGHLFKNLRSAEVDERSDSDHETEESEHEAEEILESVYSSADETLTSENPGIEDAPSLRNFRPRVSSTFMDPTQNAPSDLSAEFSKSDDSSDSSDSDTTSKRISSIGGTSKNHRQNCFSDERKKGMRLSDTEDESANSTRLELKPIDISGQSPPEPERIAAKPHPPLHLLTPLQQRLVKLNLY